MFVLLTTASSTLADNSVKIQVAAKSNNNDIKGSAQEVQERWLEISMTAFHLESSGKLKIEWTLYGDDQTTGKIVQHGQGFESSGLSQGQNEKITTKPVLFNFTPRLSIKSGSGKRATYKTVAASGVRYHGWSVRAFIDNKVAGEAYSNNGVKSRIGLPD